MGASWRFDVLGRGVRAARSATASRLTGACRGGARVPGFGFWRRGWDGFFLLAFLGWVGRLAVLAVGAL
jgi:hypothetical protein